MSRHLRYLHLDVFTNTPFTGNQLAVFTDAAGLPADLMQAITREMAYSESTFIMPRERDDTDIRMRIFTPGREMPMAGHPTIGSTFALALDGAIPTGRARWVFGLNIGPTPVDIEWDGARPARAWMTQQPPAFGAVVADADGVGRAIGLTREQIEASALPPQQVSCGVPFLFVPLKTRAAVDAAISDTTALDRLFAHHKLDADAVFIFSPEAADDGATVYSRMFAPAMGVIEDPATGAASGPLGCYLLRHGVVSRGDAGGIVSLQGAKMGRPSLIRIDIGLSTAGDIDRVRVGGESVLIGTGELVL